MKIFQTTIKLFIFSALFLPLSTFALTSAQTITVLPEHIIQGDPVMVTVTGSPVSISFASKLVKSFLFNGERTVFIPIDLKKKPGTYVVTVTYVDGSQIKKDVVINAREKIEAPLGIPEKLGGNTPASQKTLVDTLAIENASFLHLYTGAKAYWKGAFQYPVADPIVTDPYGYTRKTGEYSIAHKGSDFKADEGTPVMAMNRGVVRLVRTYRNYGKTIIVDHGLGLMTFYMHLSKINVVAGQLVTKGQVIGLSGQTGYADQPHLHLTVRINDISIDPIIFLNFFK